MKDVTGSCVAAELLDPFVNEILHHKAYILASKHLKQNKTNLIIKITNREPYFIFCITQFAKFAQNNKDNCNRNFILAITFSEWNKIIFAEQQFLCSFLPATKLFLSCF